MLGLAVALNVVLAASEVPHEVAPVHEVALVGDEEPQVVNLRGHHDGHRFATAVVADLRAIDAVHPHVVTLAMAGVIHAGEEHVLGVLVLVFGVEHEVLVGLVGRGFLLTLIDGVALLDDGLAVLAIHFELYLRGEGLTVEQGACTILLTAHVFAQGEEVLWRVLVHGRVGRRAYDDDGIRRVANNQHQHTEQRGVLNTSANERLSCLLVLQNEEHDNQHHETKEHREQAPARKGNAKQANGQREGHVLAQGATVAEGFVDSPYGDADEQGNIDDFACIERTA